MEIVVRPAKCIYIYIHLLRCDTDLDISPFHYSSGPLTSSLILLSPLILYHILSCPSPHHSSTHCLSSPILTSSSSFALLPLLSSLLLFTLHFLSRITFSPFILNLFLSPPHNHSSLFNPLICLSSTLSPFLLYLYILLLPHSGLWREHWRHQPAGLQAAAHQAQEQEGVPEVFPHAVPPPHGPYYTASVGPGTPGPPCPAQISATSADLPGTASDCEWQCASGSNNTIYFLNRGFD